MGVIRSRSNPLIKEVRRLARRRNREATGLCLVEGIQASLRALKSGAVVDVIITCPEELTSQVAMETVRDAAARGVRVAEVSSDVFGSMSGRDNPVGLAVVARPRLHGLEDVRTGSGDVVTILHGTRSPGNLGTIVRTVDAMGGSGVVVTGQSTDPFDPTAIRASVGTVFTVPIARCTEADMLSFARARGIQLIATSARADEILAEIAVSFPCGVLLGSELHGLPDTLLEAGDVRARIPVYGQASSLNLAVAAGIILYHLRARADGNT